MGEGSIDRMDMRGAVETGGIGEGRIDRMDRRDA
jgi:hypothetical protein